MWVTNIPAGVDARLTARVDRQPDRILLTTDDRRCDGKFQTISCSATPEVFVFKALALPGAGITFSVVAGNATAAATVTFD